MTSIYTNSEREFANSISYLSGYGSEIRLHLHSLIDEVEKLRAAATAARGHLATMPTPEGYYISTIELICLLDESLGGATSG